MKARFPTLGAPLFAISLLVSACGTSSGGGGYYYPPNTSGDASGGGNGNDTGGSGGAGDTGGGGNGAAIFRNGGAQEAGSFAQLGVAPMAPPAAFGSSGLDGEWNVTFSSNFAYSSATLRIDERTARLEFPDKTVPVDGCPVVGSVSYVLEIAASDDLALLWREVNIKGSASCLGGQTGAVRQFLFPLRRISRGAGQFGALAGEWDPLKFG